MRRINEIFYSLQGEGYHTGTAAVFIRFSGCNLRCPFCDTRHEDGEDMEDGEILARVEALIGDKGAHIVLTGGEPSLWIDERFVRMLKQRGHYVQIETNGTHPLPKGIDWITCSPKSAKAVLTSADELKIVFEDEESPLKAEGIEARHKFLQPLWKESLGRSAGMNTAEVVDYIKRHPEWRLSLQTHRLIGIE